ncbi:28S ribosomal protein S29-like protein [Leptotrombidium deliense]|uniref:Small ribosomal subunit protein mS29 n=1 Tax=Leptotrombidium deliense TaxID=299467 RepID=A0A443S5Y3_9ACAR|nr:28S ribosomal protein S29-like protein [Leptotrombidium deliense]
MFRNRSLIRLLSNRRSFSVCSHLKCTETVPKVDLSSLMDQQYFILPKEANDTLFRLNGWREMHKNMFNLLDERAIMVRQPFKDLVQYFNRTDFSRPVNHGNFGNGKTFTMNHFIYFCYLNDMMILHCPAPYEWIYYPQETSISEYNNMRIDTPVESTIALKAFKDMNAKLLEKLDLRTTQKYTWSVRESTEQGEPLKSVIDYGLNRMKKASDCFAVVLKEIKKAADDGKFKLLVACDVVNILYYEFSKVRYPNKHFVEVENVTIARAMLKMLKNDWKNGLVVTAVDSKDALRDKVNRLTGESFGNDLPKELLGVNVGYSVGFQALDPFIPIKVDQYSDSEIENCIDYYERKKFITHPSTKTEEGRNEIKFMSAYNPFECVNKQTVSLKI